MEHKITDSEKFPPQELNVHLMIQRTPLKGLKTAKGKVIPLWAWTGL
jgi:hypothetical protein